MLCGFKLCTDAVKILCICLERRKESKTFYMLHESIISPLWVWICFLRFWCRVQTNTSFVSPFVYNMIVFYSLFRGTSLLFILGCDVTVCSVRYDVLLGMDFFFRLNYWNNRIFKLFRNLSHFIVFQLCLKIGFALLYFRRLGILITYFDIVHSWK